jgi:hypothetical protein
MRGDFLPQLRDALGGSIFVESLSDPFNALLFERFWDIKIRFSNAQIDRVFHLPGEIKDSPDPGGFDFH